MGNYNSGNRKSDKKGLVTNYKTIDSYTLKQDGRLQVTIGEEKQIINITYNDKKRHGGKVYYLECPVCKLRVRFLYVKKTERSIAELKKTAQKDNHFEALQSEFIALENKMKEYKSKDLLNHEDEIKQILESEISARYYFQKGRLESNFKNDQEVNKAVEVFKDAALYSAILRGDGIYKVIGKPGSEVQAKANSERELDEDEKN